jgi:PIN domain nuclease of toxin-antitoxin system
MDYVTDTHSLVWYLTEDTRLSNKALAIFTSTENQGTIIVPAVVLAPLDADTLRIADKIDSELEMHDRLIVATALFYEAPLITKDENLISSRAITTIW